MNYERRIGFLAAAFLVVAGLVSAHGQTNATPGPAHAARGLTNGAPHGTNSPTAWKSSIAAGLTLTRGNSDTLLATASATTDKKWGQNEISLGADGAYGQTKIAGSGKDTVNADSLHSVGQYNILVTSNFYFYGRGEALHDGVADVQYRLTLLPGAGYYLIKNTNTDLAAEFGPGFIAEKLDDQYSSFMTLRVGEKYHHKLSDRARIWESAEYLPQVDLFSHYLVNAELGIEADITPDKKLTLRSFLQDMYNNVPAPGRLQNDAKLVTAIAYKF